MLKQCLENIGEGLLHACISSKLRNWLDTRTKLVGDWKALIVKDTNT